MQTADYKKRKEKKYNEKRQKTWASGKTREAVPRGGGMSRVQRSLDVHIQTLYCSMVRNMASEVEEPCARSLVEEKN